jgi:hypothetical protein
MLTVYTQQSNASTAAAVSTVAVSKSSESAKANALLFRLNEIKAMDKTNLNPVAKKELRNEVISISRQLKTTYGVIYISGGALLVIIIVLILLL